MPMVLLDPNELSKVILQLLNHTVDIIVEEGFFPSGVHHGIPWVWSQTDKSRAWANIFPKAKSAFSAFSLPGPQFLPYPKWRNESYHGPSLILTETREQVEYPLNTYAQRRTAQTGKALSYESCTQTHCHTQARFMPHFMQTCADNV